MKKKSVFLSAFVFISFACHETVIGQATSTENHSHNQQFIAAFDGSLGGYRDSDARRSYSGNMESKDYNRQTNFQNRYEDPNYYQQNNPQGNFQDSSRDGSPSSNSRWYKDSDARKAYLRGERSYRR